MSKAHLLFAASMVVSASAFFGCGAPAVQQTDVPKFGDTTVGEQDKIKEALKKAGFSTQVASVLEYDKDSWVVVIAPPGTKEDGTPPPDRPLPQRVLVNKHTFEVTKQGDPSEKKGARTL